MARNDGGPAFPQHVLNPTKDTYGIASNNGMSLRDWFAGRALEGMNANPELMQAITSANMELGERAFDRMAKRSYEMADAMLKAREAS